MLMYSLLILPGGHKAEAVVLSASGDSLRCAIAGRADITELKKVGGHWVNESGQTVEFGALIASKGAAEALQAERSLAAGLPS